ncbi:glycosyltransferase family 2 protein [Roseomonas sp. SSH11]|uniref:Glycosyltransferase family 2 protein n=1 Tax=Pararoseomonas baculiformis TaxID=2820812 RepID=A0ABS4ADH5_9PROT|nr:glycosyltransferase family 2 protein [Pararoseomonas baculiformis]
MTPEISIVLISYEMARELPRTLHSLSPEYQRNCPAGRCEVIVVDNGSRTPPTAADLPETSGTVHLHIFPDPTPSPAAAINFGLARARGELVGVWIDGARLASPGLIDACARAAALYPRAVVATSSFHLGPDVQYASILNGYDAAEEDRLLASIGWPASASRLPDIATPVWRSGVDGPMLESNALFMRRALWEELGGYDEAFVGPGGGAVNPDTFIRACALPDAKLIRVQREATYHQIHGGTISNAPNRAVEAGKLLAREYFRLRRKPLLPVRETGWLFDPLTGNVQEGGLAGEAVE